MAKIMVFVRKNIDFSFSYCLKLTEDLACIPFLMCPFRYYQLKQLFSKINAQKMLTYSSIFKMIQVIFIISTSSVSLSFPSSERVPLKIWAHEFPPVPNSSVQSRSVTIQNTFSGYEMLLAQLKDKYTGKLYIEINISEGEFVKFLNVTQYYQKSVQWVPCIVFHWHKKLTSFFTAEQIVSRIVSEMTSVQFSLNSEVYVAFDMEDNTLSNSNTKVCLCDLYNHKRSKASYIKICQLHILQKPLFATESFFSYKPVSVKRRNLKATKLNVIAQYDPDYKERILIHENKNGTVEFIRGMCLEILLALQISMNFSYVAVKGNGWVGLFPNKSWTGMASQLINEEGDFSIAQASMVMMIDQLSQISFLQPSSAGHFVALFRQPKASSYKNLLTSVLTTQCWKFYFITWMIIVGTVLCIWILQRQFSEWTDNDLAFVKGTVMWAITTVCIIGWYIRPSSMSYRSICVLGSYLAYCTFIAFQAGLTVNLVTEVLPIKNFKELALSNLQVFTDKWLPVSRSLVEKIYSQRGVQIPLENSQLYSVDMGIPKVIHADPPVAFITFTDAVPTVFHRLPYTDQFYCERISSVMIASERTPAGMFVRRRSPLKEVLNYNILMMIESGIVSRLNKQYDVRTQILCLVQPNNYRGGLSLEDIRTPFSILAAGFLICITNLFCEKLCHRLQPSAFHRE